MIVVTGAAGFIGSALIAELNRQGYQDIVAVDDFSKLNKKRNLENATITHRIERSQFFDWVEKEQRFIQIIIHLGARTDTSEFNVELLDELNTTYSKKVWGLCYKYGISLIYASSAATYGDGQFGYSDKHEISEKLEPLNPYGVSKNEFDKWVLKQENAPYFWAGLKFFNVYGPNEYHKDRMASVVLHAFNQIKKTGSLNLFRSHNPNFKDGFQERDFIYVKDVVQVIINLMEQRKTSGIFNLGTGKCRTFNDLAHAVFNALGLSPDIRYIDTPIDIRDKYQYHTQAEMQKLKATGCALDFKSLEEGVTDYVTNHLIPDKTMY